MNERLKDLAREAGLLVYNPEGAATKLEKFAELIVRECADVAYKYNRCDWADVSKHIKEHFGVEE